ncbi:MAG TPA: ParA family protein [Planctomycetes bacterium]|nr:ParA family protein [Planctomycetota bacterium]
MQIWALANQKGGTGKTTTAIHLAGALAGHGKRCLLVDLDPQAHATLGMGVAVEEGVSIASTFLDSTPLRRVIRTTRAGFHLAPSEVRLGEFEEVAERSLLPEGILAGALGEVSARYDWVILDCPPRADGVLTRNAIRAATMTLLVVETGAFALQGALRARRLFEEQTRELGRPLPLRLLATMFERDSPMSREFLIALQARFRGIMLDTVIRRDEVLRRAVACGIPAPNLDPNADAVDDFEALAEEVAGIAQEADSWIPRGACSPPTFQPEVHPLSDDVVPEPR